MATFPTIPSWSARNPLGILALFIALIYGMAALLLGVAVTHITESNQTILVAFLAAFPVAVLGIFAWLVARHHRKLYGPGDFRSDDGFLADPATLGARLKAEAVQEEVAVGGNVQEVALQRIPARDVNAPAVDASAEVLRPPAPDPKVIEARPAVATAFLAESLVFQELQRELSGSLRREVALRSPSTGDLVRVDGIVENSLGRWVIEILFVRNLGPLRRRLANLQRLAGLGERIIVALVADEQVADTPSSHLHIEESARAALMDLGLSEAQVRIYRLPMLLKKYGLAADNS